MSIRIGKIVYYSGEFYIQRDKEDRFEKYNPNKDDESLLRDGDQLKVPAGVTVKVQCDHNDRIVTVAQERRVPVKNICPIPVPFRSSQIISERLTTLSFCEAGEKSQHRHPEKLGEIAEYPVGKKFQIKRHSWAGFKDYHSTWGTGLYEGDQLKVPPGVTVKVRFENNEEVQVTDNNQPWDLLDNWQNQ